MVSEIQEIRRRDDTVGMRLKLYDKTIALDRLAKLCDLYRDDRADRGQHPINIRHGPSLGLGMTDGRKYLKRSS